MLGDDVLIIHLDSKFCCAAFEDNGCIGLGDHTNDDEDDACEAHVDPEEEVETTGADVDPTTYNGAEDWTAVWSCGEVSDGRSSLLDVPDICYCSTC